MSLTCCCHGIQDHGQTAKSALLMQSMEILADSGGLGEVQARGFSYVRKFPLSCITGVVPDMHVYLVLCLGRENGCIERLRANKYVSMF